LQIPIAVDPNFDGKNCPKLFDFYAGLCDIVDICIEGLEMTPIVDKSGQGDRFLPMLCRGPLWTSPYKKLLGLHMQLEPFISGPRQVNK